jgi:hypothetical protein
MQQSLSKSSLPALISQKPREFTKALAWLPSLVRGMSFIQSAFGPHAAAHEVIDCASEAPPEVNPLLAYFESHLTGRGIWKWKHYFDIYQRHLGCFVGKEVHILEIGIYSGGSLDMWRHYFGDRCKVYGVDIEEACRSYENDYTKIFIGDQASPEFWEAFKQEVPRVDILIDDGGHQPFQQIATFEAMLSHISPGGVYLCEDIHGERNHFAAYLAGVASWLNAFDMRSDGVVDSVPLQAHVGSIHHYPYATVIEKRLRPCSTLQAPRHGDRWQPFFDKK